MTIREARKNSGLTQAEAAKLLGVSKRTIEDWEAGIRNPKGGPEKIAEKLLIAGIFGEDGRQALIDGDLTWEEAGYQYKVSRAKRLARCGAYNDTFTANWERIPAAIVEVASPEALGELVDSIKEAYDAGVEHGKEA